MTFDYTSLRIAACDLNGQMRGKRLPTEFANKVEKGAVRMPVSALNVDIWGADIEDSPLVFESGDADGFLMPTGRGALPMPWLSSDAALVPATMLNEDESPFEGDPRRALERVLERYAARGWQVRAATEMEFYLVDDQKGLGPVSHPQTGRPLENTEVLSLAELDAFESFFDQLYQACDEMGIPAQSAIAEAGIGQFEIDIDHRDALEAADNAWLFKALVKGLARQNDMAATFMAKPFADDAGTGLHVHFSVVDAEGNNIFDDGSELGNATLLNAVAGCLEAMAASTLIFAPHGPSYDRMVPGAHAPTAICWGYENRTAALRIPAGPPQARRIEHRLAGGDINPYLHLAAVLGAAIDGIEREALAPAPIAGNAYEEDHPQLATSWADAIHQFENDAAIKRIFHPLLIENLVMTKRQEMRLLAQIEPEDVWKTYLETA
ncbi:glutamine synthetase family protein [Lentibacter algarum]|uniref:glutamine synthetase family protein n=1 Tax=Lentibacter algarum TaxID=576131 RepID=UPI001C0A2C26|nr:glutamine synthetase family protein [Lentibacter algarum]MBU2982759.1 glutamine synthetase family protein [Lentibacter algarum]